MGTNKQLLICLTLVATLVWGCAPSDIQTASALSTGTSTTLAVSGPANLSFSQAATYVATGGTAPYTYSVESSGTQPGTINPTTGAYQAPAMNETVQIAVQDASGAFGSLTVTIGSGTGGTTVGGLTISPATANISIGGDVQFTTTGGSGSYTYTMVGVGEVNSGVYYGTSAGTATITVTDTENTSLVGTATVVVGGGSSGSSTLAVSPANPTVVPGQSVELTPSGGTPPYAFGIISGSGTFSVTQVQSGGTTTYTSPGNSTGTIVLSLQDSAGNSIQIDVTLGSGSGTTGPVSASFSMSISKYFAVTYDNTGDYPSGAGYTSDTPMFWIWGSGSSATASGVGANGSSANYLPLTNYSNAAMSPTTYRGYFEVATSTVTTTINFCIPPATSGNSMAAYVQQSGGSTGFFEQQHYNATGEYIASGQLLDAFFVQANTVSSTVTATINFLGEYTSNANCSDFASNMYVEVL